MAFSSEEIRITSEVITFSSEEITINGEEIRNVKNGESCDFDCF